MMIEQILLKNERKQNELRQLIKNEKFKHIMIVSDGVYENTYLKEEFSNLSQSFIVFNQYTSNPKYEDICKGVDFFKEKQCDCLIAIGGGSTIDVAKSIKLFSVLDENNSYLEQELIESNIPLIAVPTTAGTGSEANGNIVLYVNGVKKSLYHECARPNYIYFEPDFLDTLSDYTRRSTLADAMAQCIESIWAQGSNDQSIEYATEGLKLLLDNTMKYLRKDKSVYKDIQKGAYYSGKAIDISKTTAAHAMSYALASECHLTHGHSVFMLLPSVCEELTNYLISEYNIISYDDFNERLPENIKKTIQRLEIIRKIIYPSDKKFSELSKQLNFIYRILGLEIPEFIGEEKINYLVDNVNIERLENHPIKLSKESIKNIYISSFKMEYINGEYVFNEDYQKIKDRQEFVSGLQELTLETLLLTQKFLNEHNLRFYLAEGTLLGCVRHNGFIPWDDDVDICMPRDDYDRLVELANEGKIPKELNFDALENNKKHWVLGAKMQLVRETDYIQEKVIPLSKCHGPYVDIFPLDYWPKPYSFKQRVSDLCVKISRRMLFMKTGYSKATKKKLARIILRIICIFVKNEWIEKFTIMNMKKYKNDDRNYLVNLCSYYPFYKEVFPISCFGKPTMVEFNGHLMPIPREYDFVLKTIYGIKYDTIPPYTVTDMRKHAFTLRENKI